jgi:hypothetical protein
MPDFTLEPQASATFRTTAWEDPAFTLADARAAAIAASGLSEAAFNALPAEQQGRWMAQAPQPRPSRVTTIQDRNRYAWTVNVGTLLKVWVKPDGGVAGAPDSALDSRLPYAWFVETPYGPDSPSFTPGLSSQLYFLPTVIGHYTLVVRRPLGGAVVLHIDCVNPAPP